MIDLIILVILCTMFAYIIQTRATFFTNSRELLKKDFQSKYLYFGIMLAFVFFAGLRSRYNDTYDYMHGFKLINANSINLSVLFQPYGGFEIYQQLIKKYLSEDPQIFIFVTSVITNLLYLKFYTRHTNKYSEMIFLYTTGFFLFSMAGIKQAIAIAISLYMIEYYLNKKYIKSLLVLLLAMTFHPYILCLICIPFLKDKIWNKGTMIVIIICVIAVMNMEKVFELFSFIGKDYSNETFNNYTINPIRVLVESIPVIISFIYRNKLKKNNNQMLILGINMRIVSFLFITMGLFMNPIYFGRMSSYFTVLSAIAIPTMLSVCWKENRDRKIYVFAYYLFFFVYFLMDMTKIGHISIFIDQFNHVSLDWLFR